jgi:ferritin-like metal-binding protein YciE
MGMQSIEELFEYELKDILGGEQSLLDALEQMAQESSDREKSLGQKAEAETCAGIEGLIKEKKVFMREKPSEELLEFFNIGAAQKVERYEITSYENLIDMADKLGMTDAVELLEQNLQEEEAALNKLKAIASEFDVTDESESGEEEEEEEEEEETATSRR